jgi:hypothetical protein
VALADSVAPQADDHCAPVVLPDGCSPVDSVPADSVLDGCWAQADLAEAEMARVDCSVAP